MPIWVQFMEHGYIIFLTCCAAGVVITAGILTAGLFALKNNNQMQQQALMRLRVGAQAMTVLAVVASLGVQERQKSLGMYRR